MLSVGLPRSESLFVPLQAISTEGAVELVLTGGEGLPSGVEGRTLALHDKNPALGDKVPSRTHPRTLAGTHRTHVYHPHAKHTPTTHTPSTHHPRARTHACCMVL